MVDPYFLKVVYSFSESETRYYTSFLTCNQLATIVGSLTGISESEADAITNLVLLLRGSSPFITYHSQGYSTKLTKVRISDHPNNEKIKVFWKYRVREGLKNDCDP